MFNTSNDKPAVTPPYRWATCRCPTCGRLHEDVVISAWPTAGVQFRQACDDCYLAHLGPEARAAYLAWKSSINVALPDDGRGQRRPVQRSLPFGDAN